MLKTRTPPHLITLILLTGFSPLTLNMFVPSLANIADEMATDYATVSLAVAGYLAVTVVIQLVVGPLSDRVGRRPVLLAALAVFTGASIGCALAQDVWTFLLFRMFQGGMTAGYTLSLAIVRDTRSERQAAGLIGYIGMAMALAPMLGPMLGGMLDTAFGWRANFHFYTLSGMCLFALCWFDLGETKTPHAKHGNTPPETVHELAREPLFWAFACCSAFSTGAFYVFVTGAPLVTKSDFGVTTAELGVYMGTITAGFMTGSLISARLAPKVEPIMMMLAGRIIACSGPVIGTAALAAGFVSPVMFFGSTVLVGLGNGLTMPSSNTSAMSVRPKLAGTAAGLNGALIVGTGAALATLTGQALPQQGAALPLLFLMLLSSGAGLIAVLFAMFRQVAEPR